MVNKSFKDIIILFYFVHRLFFTAGCASVFRQKKAPNLVEPLDRAILGYRAQWPILALPKGGYTLVTLPRTVTPYRDSMDGIRDHVTYQTLVTR
jgi:hypothetical protein